MARIYCGILSDDTVQFGRCVPISGSNILPASSGLELELKCSSKMLLHFHYTQRCYNPDVHNRFPMKHVKHFVAGLSTPRHCEYTLIKRQFTKFDDGSGISLGLVSLICFRCFERNKRRFMRSRFVSPPIAFQCNLT